MRESMWRKLKSDESGYVLIMSVFVLVILFLIGTTLAVMGVQEFTLSARTKLMDQAYSIADAGVNRAAVAIQLNTSLSASTTPGPFPVPQHGPFTETFGGGTFTWTIYQSETVPNPAYKVIRSTGAISRAGRTAERTIETRIVIGAGGDEYDASFDYLFYNGNKASWGASPPVTPPAWPTNLRFGGYVAGNYTWDGFTAYEGRSPRGAVYTKGSINVPVWLWGDIIIQGNVVATDNIALKNTWHMDWNDPGIIIGNNGKVIAGLDGSGSATVEVAACVAVTKPAMVISGQVIAHDDVTVSTTANASLSNALTINGIKAGRDVNVTGTFNLSQSITLGTMIAGRKASISSRWLNGVTATNIWAGQDTSTGDGVVLSTAAASSINVGNIVSRGRVSATGTLASIAMGTVTAGNSTSANLGGTGVYFDFGFGGCTAGTIVSTGMVDLYSSWLSTISTGPITGGTDSATGAGGTGVRWRGNTLGSINTENWPNFPPIRAPVTSTGQILADMGAGTNISTGNVTCGSNVNLNTRNLLFVGGHITLGTVQAKSFLDVDCGGNAYTAGITCEDYVRLISNDKIETGSIRSNTSVHLFSGDWGLGALGNRLRNNGSIQARGHIHWEGAARPWEGNSWISGGVWGGSMTIWRNDLLDVSDTDLEIGRIAGNDSVRASGNIRLKGAGDWWPGNDIHLTDVRLPNWATYTESGDVSRGSVIRDDNVGIPAAISVATPPVPTKPNPVYVDRNGVLDEPGPAGQAKNVDVLAEAGLMRPVDLLQPNWAYFETMASRDDAINPAAPHMVYDGGPGDADGFVDGNIELVWDNSKPYSSRETVYNGDPDVELQIRTLNWAGKGAMFEGTIVSRADVTITAPNTDWFMDTEQVLNVVAGNNLTAMTSGLTLWENTNCHYHFWADNNIDLTNMRFSLGGNQTYFGSFTAGNRVAMADNSFWPNSTFRWSRWALDPVAWAPPFQVLTWREI